MALYSVSSGNAIVALDVDQYLNLLTGVMADQAVTLRHGSVPLTLQNAAGLGVFQLRSDNSATSPGMPWVRTDGGFLVINPVPTHDLYLIWDSGSGICHIGPSSAVTLKVGEGAGPLVAGPATLASVASSGAVSGTSGTFTGAVQSNSHPVVEGTAGATHVEVYGPTGSDSLGTGGTVSKTFTFARAFASAPAVVASCQSTAANHWNVGVAPTAVSTTGCTFEFANTDAGNQTLSNYMIIAVGN